MRDDEFEWDDAKASTNRANHGVSFDAARDVFRDPFALDWLDDRENYGEESFSTIGLVDDRVVYVA